MLRFSASILQATPESWATSQSASRGETDFGLDALTHDSQREAVLEVAIERSIVAWAAF
jgi:hypothetical protein